MKYLTIFISIFFLSIPVHADSIIIGGLSYHYDRNFDYNEKHACLGYARNDFSIIGCDKNSHGNKSIYLLYKPHKYFMVGAASGYENTSKNIPMIGNLAIIAGLTYTFDFGKVRAPVVMTTSGLISWINIDY